MSDVKQKELGQKAAGPKAAGPKEVGEEALIEIRRGKAAELRAAGLNPFANDAQTDKRSFVAELRERFAAALQGDGEDI